jgi:drug/metabolite transporter (DMT)-like permease
VRTAGTLLILEGALWLIVQFLTLVYLFATQVYVPDEEHRPLAPLALWLLVSGVVFAVAIRAGLSLRRVAEPQPLPTVSLIVAVVANVLAVVASANGLLTQRRFSVESSVAWILIGGAAIVVLVGIGMLVRSMRGRGTDRDIGGGSARTA